MRLLRLLDRLFELEANRTHVGREALAGLVSFLAMSYIIVVNPMILSHAGMDREAVFVATVLASAAATLVFGLVANLPFGLAPGMGINAFFAYTIVMQMGYTWQAALAAVFITGLVMFVLSVTPFRRMLMESIPVSLKAATSAGIGLFIMFVGLKSSQIVTSSEATITTLGNLQRPDTALALLGFVMLVVCHQFRVAGGVLLTIVTLTVIGIALGMVHLPDHILGNPFTTKALSTINQMDFKGLFEQNPTGILFSLLLVIFFDATGTLVGLSEMMRLSGVRSFSDTNDPRYTKALATDAASSMFSGWLGTSPTTVYVESSAGILGAGGRTGLTAVVIGLLFIASGFLWPLISMIPMFATAPVLMFVGLLMLHSTDRIDWKNYPEALASGLIIVMMPLSSSITDGLAFGFIAYIIARIVAGEFRKIHPILYVVTAAFVAALATR